MQSSLIEDNISNDDSNDDDDDNNVNHADKDEQEILPKVNFKRHHLESPIESGPWIDPSEGDPLPSVISQVSIKFHPRHTFEQLISEGTGPDPISIIGDEKFWQSVRNEVASFEEMVLAKKEWEPNIDNDVAERDKVLESEHFMRSATQQLSNPPNEPFILAGKETFIVDPEEEEIGEKEDLELDLLLECFTIFTLINLNPHIPFTTLNYSSITELLMKLKPKRRCQTMIDILRHCSECLMDTVKPPCLPPLSQLLIQCTSAQEVCLIIEVIFVLWHDAILSEDWIRDAYCTLFKIIQDSLLFGNCYSYLIKLALLLCQWLGEDRIYRLAQWTIELSPSNTRPLHPHHIVNLVKIFMNPISRYSAVKVIIDVMLLPNHSPDKSLSDSEFIVTYEGLLREFLQPGKVVEMALESFSLLYRYILLGYIRLLSINLTLISPSESRGLQLTLKDLKIAIPPHNHITLYVILRDLLARMETCLKLSGLEHEKGILSTRKRLHFNQREGNTIRR